MSFDTSRLLISSLSEMLVDALNGSWDRFEVAQANALTWKQRYNVVITVTRSAVVAVLPAVLFIGAQHAGVIDIDRTMTGYITAGLVLWGTLSIISAVDPTQVTLIKDILPNIPLLGKRSEK